MAFQVFSQRPQQLPACGRRWRSFGLGEKTLETWERQRQKPFVRKYRLIRSMFSLGKSNVCVDNFGQMLRQRAGVLVDSSGGARPLQRATGAWKQLRQKPKRRLDLAKRDYLRQRIEPKPGDRYYPRLYRLGVAARCTACCSEAAHITRRT